jgi:hypothetical protein
MTQRNFIVVFDDGETFNDLKGCKILEISDNGLEILNEGGTPKDLDLDDIYKETEISEFLSNAMGKYDNWDRM